MSINIVEFDALFRKYQQAVFVNIKKYVKDEMIAEDILQEVFMALWNHRDNLTDMDRIPGWLFVVSANMSTTHLKNRLKRELVLIEDHVQLCARSVFDEENISHVQELQWKVLEEAIEELPEKRKEVFKLCKLEGRSYKDVAEMLGISVESVKDYLKKSNKSVRLFVSEKYQPEDSIYLIPLIYFLSP